MSGPDDGKRPMIENIPRETLKEVVHQGETLPEELSNGKESRKVPAGHVERVLNFKDRNYLVGACRAFCERDGHKTFKDQKKLEQVRKIVNFDATLDQTAEINDALEDATLKWEGAKAQYKTWRQYKECLLDQKGIEDMRKKYPGLDLENGPEKPPLRAPELAPKDQRGPEGPFYFPSKLDAWVQGALEAMEWPTIMTEYAVELCEKFGIEEK